MPLILKISIFLASLFIFVITTYFLKKGRIPEKYSLLWYFICLVIFVLVLFPKLFVFISIKLGIQTVSNLIVAILLVLLIFITMSLTIIVSGQKKKTTLIIQELSLLKKEMDKKNEKK